EWINVALGAWLIASTWVLGIVTPAARTNFMLVGVLVVALALYEITPKSGKADLAPLSAFESGHEPLPACQF
ncbi:MAG: SPW repeat protein, partial [Pseudolabrys sp.]